MASEAHAKHLELKGVDKWGYWNNSDRPETVGDIEWAIRKQDWSIVGLGPAVNYGLSVTLAGTDLDIGVRALRLSQEEWAEVAHLALEDKERLSQRAVMNDLWCNLVADRNPHPSNLFGMLMDTHDAAEELIARKPDVVKVPDYDPALIGSDEAFEHITVDIPDEEFHAILEKVFPW